MSEEEKSPVNEQQNTEVMEEDAESWSALEQALEDQIDQLDFSEFEEEEENWSLFRRGKDSSDKKKKDEKSEDRGTDSGEAEPEDRNTGSTDEKSESRDADPAEVKGRLSDSKKKASDKEKAPGDETEEEESREDEFDEDEFDEAEFSDDEFEEDEFEDEDFEEDDSFEEDSEEEDSGSDRYDEDDADLDNAEYMQSARYRRRERRTLSYEQREARRQRRITAFWDFVVRNRKQIRWMLLGILVVMAAGAAAIISRNWKYHSLKDLVVSEKEDTLSVSYANINGKVLKYGVDSAMLVDQDNTMLWTVSYSMEDPEVDICGDTFVIYDNKGTLMRVCNASGQIGEISANMPVVKASVSGQGVVAAILEDGQNAWINLYSSDGSEIATLKTTFTNPGYPMDIGLSQDGTLLSVSYLYMDNGTPVSRVSFYNFGNVGQNQKDNLVAENEYRDNIVPEVEYMDASNCVAFREDGFSVYRGSQIPSEDVTVEADENIVSTFYDSQYIGLVLQNVNAEYEYTICLYNLDGRKVLEKGTDFSYESVELNGEQILMAAEDEICVYSLQGVEKYTGVLETPARVFTGFGRNKFIYVSENLFKIVQLN